MLYREIICVCSDENARYRHALCGQNVEFFLTLNPVVRIVTTVFEGIKNSGYFVYHLL
jgi:hypothetical protein